MPLGLTVKLNSSDQEQRFQSCMPQSKKEGCAPRTDLKHLWSWTKHHRWDFFYLIHSPASHLLSRRASCHPLPVWHAAHLCQGAAVIEHHSLPTAPLTLTAVGECILKSQTEVFHSCPSPTMEDLLPPQLCQCKFLSKLSKLDLWNICSPKHLSFFFLKKKGLLFCFVLNTEYLRSSFKSSQSSELPPCRIESRKTVRADEDRYPNQQWELLLQSSCRLQEALSHLAEWFLAAERVSGSLEKIRPNGAGEGVP